MYSIFYKIKADLIKKLLNRHQSFLIQVFGTSMLPILRSGEKIIAENITEFINGQIYLFINPLGGRLVCHRLISVEERYCVMKGDNEDYILKVPHELVLGICSKMDGAELLSKRTTTKKLFGSEWLFDKNNDSKYWLWHIWLGNEMFVYENELTQYIGEYSIHPCLLDINNYESKIDLCEYFTFQDWVFVAVYDPRESKIKFRFLKDNSWVGLSKATLHHLLEKRIDKNNFYQRQFQYMGLIQ